VEVGVGWSVGGGEIGAEGDGGDHADGLCMQQRGSARDGDGVGRGLRLSSFVAVDEVPGRAVVEELLDEGGVHGVAGSLGDDSTPNAVAGEGEVADEVEDFVANELVGETEGAVEDGAVVGGGGAGDDDGGVVGHAADEAHVAEHGFVFLEAEGAGGGDEVGVGTGFEVAGKCVVADGLGEVDGVVDGVAVAGIDADELVAGGRAFADFDGLEDADVLAFAALAFEAGGEDGGDVGEGAAVEDGDLEVVDFYDDVVDAEADEGGEKVLSGLDEDALAHEGGRVGDARDVAAGGGDLEVVQVGAAEDNAGAGGCGDEAHGDGGAGVEAHSLEVQGGVDRLLELGTCRQAQISLNGCNRRLYRDWESAGVANLPQGPAGMRRRCARKVAAWGWGELG